MRIKKNIGDISNEKHWTKHNETLLFFSNIFEKNSGTMKSYQKQK